MIRRKKEISAFLENFETYAHFDGEKYYLTIETVNPNGTLALMKYRDGEFTYHRKNDLYWDIRENKTDDEMLTDIVWAFRKAINQCIREKVS